MRWEDKENYPKEIIIDLEKYKEDEEVRLKCFVAHDYVAFETHTLIEGKENHEDREGKGYWIKTYIQIPINTMAKLLQKLNSSPFLIHKKHFSNKGYLYRDEVIRFEEWHLKNWNSLNDKKYKGRQEFLFRAEGDTKWYSIKKDKWNNNTIKILKNLQKNEKD